MRLRHIGCESMTALNARSWRGTMLTFLVYAFFIRVISRPILERSSLIPSPKMTPGPLSERVTDSRSVIADNSGEFSGFSVESARVIQWSLPLV